MELYFNQNKEKSVLKLYHKLWADTDVEAISSACREYMQKGKNKFFPKAGEILDIVNFYSVTQGGLEAQAQQQWRIVMASVGERGEGKGAPLFEDPITKTLVIHQFRWQYLCNIQVDNLNWEEKRFCEAYSLASEMDPAKLSIGTNSTKLKQLVAGIGNK